MRPFHSRQMLLIGVVIGSLIVAIAASYLLRGLLLPVYWGRPLYLNPLYLFLLIFVGGTGLLTVMRTDDKGWPWFLGVVGLLGFIIAIEDSILQWFLFQQGIATVGSRINPVLIGAMLVAVAATILLHVGQLGRRLRHGLVERGLDPRELSDIETRTLETGRDIVLRVLGVLGIVTIVLYLFQWPLLRASLGIGALGILGGLLILSILSVTAYRILRTGPNSGPVIEERLNAAATRRRRPPGGLR